MKSKRSDERNSAIARSMINSPKLFIGFPKSTSFARLMGNQSGIHYSIGNNAAKVRCATSSSRPIRVIKKGAISPAISDSGHSEKHRIGELGTYQYGVRGHQIRERREEIVEIYDDYR